MAGLLGISAANLHSAISFADCITAGLPVDSLFRVCDSFAPKDKSFKYRIVGKSSLARRKKSGRLSPAESEKLARLVTVWTEALEIWKSDGPARDFLTRPHMLLKMRPALDVALQSEVGAQRVLEILGGIVHGTAI
jgi:putative toxin-antitoxin system antitoxin component (TIGR02293 family)